eukprot:TRINITY_DN29455_c0_g1_i1.p1 TRINITY_DN29455_c0_g1~~TRINITY_DN29455_c0_g1_i1.p1  ORF type:complete len:1062 (+),score=166.24 TRINITY_DN29455_c0_g1_i1:133-3318(+)
MALYFLSNQACNHNANLAQTWGWTRGGAPAARRRSGFAHLGRPRSTALKAWGTGHILTWGAVYAVVVFRRAFYRLAIFLAVHGWAAQQRRYSKRRPALGREDQAADEAGAATVVLTDKICLIPGGSAVVRIEDAPGNARRIFTGIDIRATVDEVWKVLIDYDSLTEVVPNLVENQVIKRDRVGGGARLWQIGRSSWTILGRKFYFQAGMTLDVRLHPEGLCTSGLKTAGTKMDASDIELMTSAEVRERGKGMEMVRDVFPRPFSIASPGVPVRDITMQNAIGEKGDFVHYQGVWRFQPLLGCGLPDEDLMRLTFAVECQPHWFLPVAPVEGRIADALAENMGAIRDHVEAHRTSKSEDLTENSANADTTENSSDASQYLTMATDSMSAMSGWLSSFLNDLPKFDGWITAHSTRQLPRHVRKAAFGVSLPRGRRAGPKSWKVHARKMRKVTCRSFQFGKFAAGEAVQVTEAMAETLQKAQLQLLEREEASAMAGACTDGALGSVAGSASESVVSFGLAGIETITGFETEAFLASVFVAACGYLATSRKEEVKVNVKGAEQLSDNYGADELEQSAWRAVLEQYPEVAVSGKFLGIPFAYEIFRSRWSGFVQILGIHQEQALEIIEQDATPLLVESEDVEDVLRRLVAICSREKALELVRRNPTLLVGGAAGYRTGDLGFAPATIADFLYAGRLFKVLEDDRDNEGKLKEIELYSCLLSGFKPCVDLALHKLTAKDANAAIRRLFRTLQQAVEHSSMQVFLNKVATAPDPWEYLCREAKAGLSMAGSLARRPGLTKNILPHAAPIVSHMPSIYTRLSILGPHVPGIARILDPYFDTVEPYLDRIMERMDRIEPHLPYILLHLDVLAPHCGPLLDHFDTLMPYADNKESIGVTRCLAEVAGVEVLGRQQVESCFMDWDKDLSQTEVEKEEQSKSYLPLLLPYVDFLVPQLDVLAPHLQLVHPHIPYVLPYMDDLLPFVSRFVGFPRAARNADKLIGYFGWLLRVPLVRRILHLPLVPRLVTGLSIFLPRKLIRQRLERLRRQHEMLKDDKDDDVRSNAGRRRPEQ